MSGIVVFGNAPEGIYKSIYQGYRLDYIARGKLRLFHDFLILNDDESVRYVENKVSISNRMFAIALNNRPKILPDGSLDTEVLGRNPKSNAYKLRTALLKKGDYDEKSTDIPSLQELANKKQVNLVKVKKKLSSLKKPAYCVVEVFSEIDDEFIKIEGVFKQ